MNVCGKMSDKGLHCKKFLRLCVLTCLRLANQELQAFEKALKKKEFRDLLTEYVKEIQDPENKKVCVCVCVCARARVCVCVCMEGCIPHTVHRLRPT